MCLLYMTCLLTVYVLKYKYGYFNYFIRKNRIKHIMKIE